MAQKKVHGLFAFYRAKEGETPLVIASSVDISGFGILKKPFADQGKPLK